MRKAAAEKLYESIITNEELFFGEEEVNDENDEQNEDDDDDDDDVGSSKLDRCTALLTETQWDAKDVNDVRPARNELCDLLGIRAPVSVAKK